MSDTRPLGHEDNRLLKIMVLSIPFFWKNLVLYHSLKIRAQKLAISTQHLHVCDSPRASLHSVFKNMKLTSLAKGLLKKWNIG